MKKLMFGMINKTPVDRWSVVSSLVQQPSAVSACPAH